MALTHLLPVEPVLTKAVKCYKTSRITGQAELLRNDSLSLKHDCIVVLLAVPLHQGKGHKLGPQLN